ncbi:hypothetical protein VP01_1829g3 [Puccinia sorghi]|uniref:Uncharacterized protein n=1 Tax=Puccinia sorghi TaxID=27349 RepID=A0A0L6VDW6_9BASI|nr:hypothetical protein VP01_1829g3 [Puccinia sorghi]
MGLIDTKALGTISVSIQVGSSSGVLDSDVLIYQEQKSSGSYVLILYISIRDTCFERTKCESVIKSIVTFSYRLTQKGLPINNHGTPRPIFLSTKLILSMSFLLGYFDPFKLGGVKYDQIHHQNHSIIISNKNPLLGILILFTWFLKWWIFENKILVLPNQTKIFSSHACYLDTRSQLDRFEKLKNIFFGLSKNLSELDLETKASIELKNIQILPRGWYSRMPTATVYVPQRTNPQVNYTTNAQEYYIKIDHKKEKRVINPPETFIDSIGFSTRSLFQGVIDCRVVHPYIAQCEANRDSFPDPAYKSLIYFWVLNARMFPNIIYIRMILLPFNSSLETTQKLQPPSESMSIALATEILRISVRQGRMSKVLYFIFKPVLISQTEKVLHITKGNWRGLLFPKRSCGPSFPQVEVLALPLATSAQKYIIFNSLTTMSTRRGFDTKNTGCCGQVGYGTNFQPTNMGWGSNPLMQKGGVGRTTKSPSQIVVHSTKFPEKYQNGQSFFITIKPIKKAK